MGSQTQAFIRPTPALKLARPATWYFLLAGSDEADGDSQTSAEKENGLVFRTLEGMWQSLLRLDDVNKLLPEGQMSLVPAAGAVSMLRADIMLGLVPIELPFQQPVCPEALVGGRDGAGHCIAGGDLAATVQMVVVIQTFSLQKGQVLPGLNVVAQMDEDFPITEDLTSQEILLLAVSFQSHPTEGGIKRCIDILNIADFLKPFEHLYLFDFIPDHFLSVSRVCTGRNYLLTGDFGPDCERRAADMLLGVRGGAAARLAQPQRPKQCQQPQQQRPARRDPGAPGHVTVSPGWACAVCQAK